MVKKLEVSDLLDSIEYVTRSSSSSDNFKNFSESPIHVLVYNEIKRFSKKEIESCEAKKRWTSLSDLAFKNSFLLSAFLEKGAFHKNLSPASKWILKSGIPMDDFLYETIFYIEDDARRNNRGYIGESKSEKSQRNNLFYFLCDYRPDNLFNLNLLDKYYNEFGAKDQKHILNYIYKNAGSDHSSGELANFFHMKLVNDNFDFQSSDILNNILPQNKRNDDSKFFISSSDIPRVKTLLDYGFRFNEQSYSYGNDNLFTAIIKSGRKDIIETILPTLKSPISEYGNKEDQDRYLRELITKAPNTTLIETIYNKCLLDSQLSNNKEETKKKVKI